MRQQSKSKSLAMVRGRLASPARVRRIEMSDKAFLIIRPDNIPTMLKPIRCLLPYTCAISGRKIEPGEYTYPCHESPIQLSPTGKSRVMIEQALLNYRNYFSSDIIVLQIPTAEKIANLKQLRAMQDAHRKSLEKEATRLLKEGRKQ